MRFVALLVFAFASSGALLSRLPGRSTERQYASCTGSHDAIASLVGVVRPDCGADTVVIERPAVDGAVGFALVVVALGALLVAARPSRPAIGVWLGGSAAIAVLAFVVTRSWSVRASETVWLWPRYATWALVIATATTMLGICAWHLGAEAKSK